MFSFPEFQLKFHVIVYALTAHIRWNRICVSNNTKTVPRVSHLSPQSNSPTETSSLSVQVEGGIWGIADTQFSILSLIRLVGVVIRELNATGLVTHVLITAVASQNLNALTRGNPRRSLHTMQLRCRWHPPIKLLAALICIRVFPQIY